MATTPEELQKRAFIETTKTAAIIILAVALMASICAALSILPGCMTSPDKENYPCDECYMAADALYRLKSANDKAVASPLVEACRDAMKEKTRISRLKYCHDSRPDDMTERECRSWVNEK